MKKYFQAFIMTQSMFCALPCPCRTWNEKARPYMMLFLPLVGLEIGAAWVLAHTVLCFIQVPNMIYGLVMCAVTYLISGFIHLDGFFDVTDAISSWKTLEQRRAILKDSNVGAFSVIWCVFLILTGFAAFSSVSGETNGWILLTVPVLSRCCSAMAVMNLKPMSTSQYAGTSAYPKWHTGCMVFVILLLTVLGFAFGGKYGFVVVATLLGYGFALLRSYRLLDGMNGDISGFCLTIGELCGTVAFALL